MKTSLGLFYIQFLLIDPFDLNLTERLILTMNRLLWQDSKAVTAFTVSLSFIVAFGSKTFHPVKHSNSQTADKTASFISIWSKQREKQYLPGLTNNQSWVINPIADNCFAVVSYCLLPYCRRVRLQRTTRATMESWVCVFAESLLDELRAGACAGAGRPLSCSSGASPVEIWSWCGAMTIRSAHPDLHQHTDNTTYPTFSHKWKDTEKKNALKSLYLGQIKESMKKWKEKSKSEINHWRKI